ncbi:MAG: transmembrane 220 family protein [Leptospira sp.]|nr:transmembrane 220 family protein [Leptospira sp.]
MQKAFQILFFLLAVLLLFSALVQYNDPDPLHWMFLYGYSAILCGFGSFRRIDERFLYFALGAVLLQLLIVFDGAYTWLRLGQENMLKTPMSSEKPYIEEIREFLGASIAGLANLLLLWKRRL